MKAFSQNFATKNDQTIYLLSLKKKKRASAYSVMMKDRTSKLPREERLDYLLYEGGEDYKSLTSSELQDYQQMADNITAKGVCI